MADPDKYSRTYSFTDYQAGNPSAPLPGIQVDNELENVEQSLGEAIDAIKDVRRSDGKLKNGIVTVDSLDPTVAAGVGAGALASAQAAAASADAASDSAVAAAASATAASGSATAASGYASNALTSRNEAATEKTLAQTARTGAQTARDFAAAWASAAEGVDVDDGVNPVNKSAYHWAQVALDAAAGSIADGSVTTAKIVDGAVTEAKLASAVQTSIANSYARENHTGTQALSTINADGGTEGQVASIIDGVPGWVDPIGFVEGTFTPSITFATPGNLSVSVTRAYGSYSRIGNRVFFDIEMSITPTFTTASGNLLVTGLPFASVPLGSGSPGYAVAVASTASFTYLTNQRDLSARLNAGTSQIVFLMSVSANNGQIVTASNVTSGLGLSFILSGSYKVA